MTPYRQGRADCGREVKLTKNPFIELESKNEWERGYNDCLLDRELYYKNNHWLIKLDIDNKIENQIWDCNYLKQIKNKYNL